MPGVYLTPDDDHNQELMKNVHPREWVNPEPTGRYNLVVIGAGTAGLVTAAGAAGLGAKVALVERLFMGGDCLNFGCVPSKGIIASSRISHALAEASSYGIEVSDTSNADFPTVMERMRAIRARISRNDSVWRFRDLGVDVFLGSARFTGTDSLDVEGETLRFSKAVIAAGARPADPGIPGLAEAGYLTNETVFSLTAKPDRLAVIGGGPIGCELSQAFARLGCEVFVLHKNAHILDREDPDAAEIVQQQFLKEGIRLILNARLIRVEGENGKKTIYFETADGPDSLSVDEILVGAGRIPNVEDLNLSAAGVRYDKSGVIVDDRLTTSNPRIYAAGDVCMKYKFTHMADAAARIVIQNALFAGFRKLSALTVPWCTYTDPEIAHVGMYERDAAEKGIPVETFLRSFGDVDRALLDGDHEGFVKVHVKKGSDKILGATIVGSRAGDMISEITTAMVAGVGLKTLSSVIHPYPTHAEAIKQVGDAYNRTRLTPLLKKLFTVWLRWSRR
ncbi:mercuric reductase [Desulfomonile tiedjei]|nr:mercuric reductase [Desulfomonile tiedjei]